METTRNTRNTRATRNTRNVRTVPAPVAQRPLSTEQFLTALRRCHTWSDLTTYLNINKNFTSYKALAKACCVQLRRMGLEDNMRNVFVNVFSAHRRPSQYKNSVSVEVAQLARELRTNGRSE